MRFAGLVLCGLALAQDSAWWRAAPLGLPLPSELRTEHDPPWSGDSRCGWQGELLLCPDAAGQVAGVYRRIAEPVAGGERAWLRTAGLEWRSGYRVPAAGPDGWTGFRWGQHHAPFDGWDGLVQGTAPALPSGSAAPRALSVEGPALAESTRVRLSRCGGAPLDRLPVLMLYDDSGEARLLRVQAFPPADADLACVAAALGAEDRAGGGAAEWMLSLE